MCVRVCMYIATWWDTSCECMYVWVSHVWGPEANSEHAPQSRSILSFEPRAHQFSQVGCPIRSKDLPGSCPPSAGVINGSFLWGDWCLNSCALLVQQALYWLNHLSLLLLDQCLSYSVVSIRQISSLDQYQLARNGVSLKVKHSSPTRYWKAANKHLKSHKETCGCF